MSINHTSQELKVHQLESTVLRKLERYGISARKFVKFKNQFSTKTRDNYIIKMILDSDARKLGSKGHLEDAKDVYGRLASFIASEDGENPVETLKNMHRLSLRQYSRLGYSSVKINNCGEGACRECKSLGNKILDISDALQKMPLPNPLCSFDLYRNGHSFCRCSYEPVKESVKIKSKKRREEKTNHSRYLILTALLIFLIIVVFYIIGF